MKRVFHSTIIKDAKKTLPILRHININQKSPNWPLQLENIESLEKDQENLKTLPKYQNNLGNVEKSVFLCIIFKGVKSLYLQ